MYNKVYTMYINNNISFYLCSVYNIDSLGI